MTPATCRAVARWLPLRGQGGPEARAAREAVLESIVPLVRSRVSSLRRVWAGILEPDDAAQVGMLAAWESLDSYDPEKGAVTTWASWYVRSRIGRACYRAKRRPPAPVLVSTDFLAEFVAAREPDGGRDEEASLVRGWARKLPARMREVVLATLDGDDIAEVTQRHGMTANCTRSHLYTAKRRLKAMAEGGA